jgi:hypothetical protein
MHRLSRHMIADAWRVSRLLACCIVFFLLHRICIFFSPGFSLSSLIPSILHLLSSSSPSLTCNPFAKEKKMCAFDVVYRTGDTWRRANGGWQRMGAGLWKSKNEDRTEPILRHRAKSVPFTCMCVRDLIDWGEWKSQILPSYFVQGPAAGNVKVNSGGRRMERHWDGTMDLFQWSVSRHHVNWIINYKKQRHWVSKSGMRRRGTSKLHTGRWVRADNRFLPLLLQLFLPAWWKINLWWKVMHTQFVLTFEFVMRGMLQKNYVSYPIICLSYADPVHDTRCTGRRSVINDLPSCGSANHRVQLFSRSVCKKRVTAREGQKKISAPGRAGRGRRTHAKPEIMQTSHVIFARLHGWEKENGTPYQSSTHERTHRDSCNPVKLV